jgi:hypothetical protein
LFVDRVRKLRTDIAGVLNNEQPATDNLIEKEGMNIKKKHRNLMHLGLTICFSFFLQLAFCQKLQTITDKKDILIGEQIKLTLKAPLNGLNKWIVLPDSIPHFEIVEAAKPDTINFKDDSKAIEQTITITSFDSGSWVFPPLPVEFDGVGGQPSQTVNTDSFLVNVAYAPADSTNQLRDIKPIMKVSLLDLFWVYMAGGILVLLIIIYLLYRYFKKKKKDAPAQPVSKLSPYDEAIAELKNLSLFNLQDAADIKRYHIRLADIFKNYLGRKQNKNLFNKTAGELLVNIKELGLPAENISELATALRCTDAVKFAKYLPLSNESEDCRQKIAAAITLIERTTNNI